MPSTILVVLVGRNHRMCCGVRGYRTSCACVCVPEFCLAIGYDSCCSSQRGQVEELLCCSQGVRALLEEELKCINICHNPRRKKKEKKKCSTKDIYPPKYRAPGSPAQRVYLTRAVSFSGLRRQLNWQTSKLPARAHTCVF